MVLVRIIDENGYFIKDAFVDKVTEFTIETPCPNGLYRPQWDGKQWVEGGAAPDPIPTQPTAEERLSALEDVITDMLFAQLFM